MNSELIVLNREPRCGTYSVSEGFGRRHNKLLELIEDHIDLFLTFGEMPKNIIQTKGRPVHEYKLNNNQIMFLLSIIRGNGSVVNFKCEAIKAGNLVAVLTALNDFDFGESDQRYVYAAQDDRGNIKIGISNNPKKRVKALNVGNVCKLELIFIREVNLEKYKDETLLHGQCEKYNIRSEWFTSEAVGLLT